MDTKEAVKQILADVTDRRGWRQAWDQFDEDIQEEIQETWLKILDELNKPVTVPLPGNPLIHNFIPGGPKDETGQLNPRPSCECGATMPEGIKTSPQGWFYGHINHGW